MVPARVGTEVRIWYDATALYLGWLWTMGTFRRRLHSATAGSGRRRSSSSSLRRRRSTAISSCNGIRWVARSTPSSRTSSARMAVRSRFKGDWSYTAANMTFAVKVDGSVQNSSDRDRRWTVEARIPFADLKVATPKPGEVWRGNFYRFNRDPIGAGAAQLVANDLPGVSSADTVWVSAVLRQLRFARDSVVSGFSRTSALGIHGRTDDHSRAGAGTGDTTRRRVGADMPDFCVRGLRLYGSEAWAARRGWEEDGHKFIAVGVGGGRRTTTCCGRGRNPGGMERHPIRGDSHHRRKDRSVSCCSGGFRLGRGRR